jgi:hypothetical protein
MHLHRPAGPGLRSRRRWLGGLRRRGGRTRDRDRRWSGGRDRAGGGEHRRARARALRRARARAASAAVEQSDHDDDQQQPDQRRVQPAQVAGPWLDSVARRARRPRPPRDDGAEPEPLARWPRALPDAATGSAAQPAAGRPPGGDPGLDADRLRWVGRGQLWWVGRGRRLGRGSRVLRRRLRGGRHPRLRLGYGRGLGDGRGTGRGVIRLVGNRLWPLVGHGAAARARRWLRSRRCKGGERLRQLLR